MRTYDIWTVLSFMFKAFSESVTIYFGRVSIIWFVIIEIYWLHLLIWMQHWIKHSAIVFALVDLMRWMATQSFVKFIATRPDWIKVFWILRVGTFLRKCRASGAYTHLLIYVMIDHLWFNCLVIIHFYDSLSKFELLMILFKVLKLSVVPFRLAAVASARTRSIRGLIWPIWSLRSVARSSSIWILWSAAICWHMVRTVSTLLALVPTTLKLVVLNGLPFGPESA